MLISKRKVYLSGSDWVINTVDYMMKRGTASGNICQVVLQLNTPLDEATFRANLNSFVKKFPVLQGRVARDFKLTPYWKIPATMERDANLVVSYLPDGYAVDVLQERLLQNTNRAFCYDEEYLDFHLFISAGNSVLAMRFDHRLFDGRGAESFLNLFQKQLNDSSLALDFSFVSSMELTGWKNKFAAGKSVNRALIALSQSIPQSLAIKPVPGAGLKCRLLNFNKTETSAIYEKAYREAGYLMESPFFMAVITQAVHELFVSRNCFEGDCYLIPATVDTRPGKDFLQELFFNHVSYLFYQIPVGQTGDLKELIALLKNQMYEQVKSGFPRDMSEASLLTRILPLSLYGKLMHLPAHGKIATFAFSHLGKCSYQEQQFMGSAIENLFHMPQVPMPPGIGFFSGLFNEQLNLVISYVDGVISDEELGKLENSIRRKLGVLPE